MPVLGLLTVQARRKRARILRDRGLLACCWALLSRAVAGSPEETITERATSPVFMASKASLTSSMLIVREISSSSLRSPFL